MRHERRSDREAEGARLLSEYTPQGYLGFESPLLRQFECLQARETVPVLFYDNNEGIRTDEVDLRQENSPVGCFQRIARRL